MEEQNIEALQKKVKELEEHIARQEKMAQLGMLSAGIAHEIQNPLNFVVNFSKMSTKLVDDLNDILSDYTDKMDEDDAADIEDISTSLKENMQKIKEHGDRANSIIQGILLQSRGKAGEFLPTDVANLTHEYVWLGYHAMRANDKNFNVSIVENIQNNMPKLKVIPQDLSRAVLNAANNAFYTLKERTEKGETGYTPTLTVNVALDNNELAIDITDNGMGMSPEVKSKVFENFFTTKPVGKGTGLGMGIMHDIIIKNHNGKLLIDSEEGKGTTISFRIPVA